VSLDQPLGELEPEQLAQLCAQIRQRLVQVLSKTGGHLSSNLGAVELTVALHRVFASPSDRMVWDTSHQTYVHKLLTGRNPRFETIRQTNGLCGFSCPPESPHDHFYAGHAGTALSLALGMAQSRDLHRGQEHVIPVLGDAALTCGLTLEALNNIRSDMGRLIVVLNDNAMAISRNVGAAARILSRLYNSPRCNQMIKQMGRALQRVPRYGSSLHRRGRRLHQSVKQLISTAPFFEQYGLTYIGPVDGHDLPKLIELFSKLRDLDYPVLVHVQTVKGYGLEAAMRSGAPYHGVRPFDPVSGEMLPQKGSATFPKVFGDQMVQMATKDPHLVAVTPAMSFGSCLDPMMEKFPNRCWDVGIAEGHALTVSGGLAHGGRTRVVTSIYATFLQRAIDNLLHDVCLQGQPVVLAVDRAGLSGPDGYTHHGIYDIGMMAAIPNLAICQPRNGQLLRELLQSAFSWNVPVAIRYPNMATQDQPARLQRRLGQAELLVEGSELLLIGLGHMCETALQVRNLLEADGVQATVLDPVFVKPLDGALLSKLLQTHSVVATIEEHVVTSGLGAAISQFLTTHGYKQQLIAFGLPDQYIAQGSHSDLTRQFGLTAEAIAEQLRTQFVQAVR
jgi:1-deoxy-D-xylulose-5-phosphate synthase